MSDGIAEARDRLREEARNERTVIGLSELNASLRAELDRLAAELDNVKQVEFPRRVEKVAEGWRKKYDRLAAENKRLREALEPVLSFVERFSYRWDGESGEHPHTTVERARAALKERS